MRPNRMEHLGNSGKTEALWFYLGKVPRVQRACRRTANRPRNRVCQMMTTMSKLANRCFGQGQATAHVRMILAQIDA